MRSTLACFIAVLICGAAAAQKPPADPALGAVSPHAGDQYPPALTLGLEDAIGKQLPWINQKNLLHLGEKEARAALWNAPLGRLYYQMAAEQAMAGRGGLVNGGRPLGLGMSTQALGDARHRGLQILLEGTPWPALPPQQQVRTGFDIASAIALALNAGG